TLHAYAHACLEASGDAPHLAARHARFFHSLAEDAEPTIHGPHQREGLARLDAEHANLLQALAWARDQNAGQDGLRLAVALGEYWWLSGRHSEGWSWVMTLLELPDAARRTAVRAAALSLAAGLSAHARFAQRARLDVADLETARRMNEEALTIAETAGD